MKILFLSDTGTEHMADHLFHGLVELFGNDDIIDFPRKTRYHVKELKDTGNAYMNWCQCLDTREIIPDYTTHQIIDMINNDKINLVISSIRAYDIFEEIKKQTKDVKTFILNGEDDTDWAYKNIVLTKFTKYWNKIDMIIQREYKHNIAFERKVVPMYGPCPIRNFPNLDFKKNKEVDIFCHLGDTHPFRKKLRNKIIELGNKNGWKIDVSANHYSMNEYFERMNNSKICVHAGGMGWESTHYLNIPLAKSLLMAQPPINCLNTNTLLPDPILYPNNFINKKSAIFYNNDFGDLENLFAYYLTNDAEREEITKNGYEHVVNKLSSKSLAEYIMACMDDLDYWKGLV